MKTRVLLVDDEASEREVLKGILKGEPDLELLEASNGLEAINMMLDGRVVHLCLTDIKMPEVDGVQMLQRIRRDPMLRTLPVVVSSANRDRAIVMSLAQLGISGYLLKPYDPAKVKAMVQQVVRSLQPKEPEKHVTTHEVLAHVLLLVDDSPEVRTIIKDAALQLKEWSVVEAENGQIALEALKKGLRPTLCLCDLRMPVLDGLAFVKAVRAEEALAKTPIMMITGDSSAATVRQFAELHVSGYIVKPFDVEKLQAVLRHAAQGGAAQ